LITCFIDIAEKNTRRQTLKGHRQELEKKVKTKLTQMYWDINTGYHSPAGWIKTSTRNLYTNIATEKMKHPQHPPTNRTLAVLQPPPGSVVEKESKERHHHTQKHNIAMQNPALAAVDKVIK
jgi:hypothetical protein